MNISKYKPFYREILALATPIVVSQLGHMVVHLADSIIVGQFAGSVQLAAVSLVNSLFTIIMVLGLGISYGLTPLIARYNGSKAYKECGALLTNSISINLITGISLYLLLHFGTLSIIDQLNQSQEVVHYAKPYLGYLSFSIVPLMVFQAFKQFAEGLGYTKQAMLVSIAGNIINIVVGITLVKGLFGFAHMGVTGVGISTLLDRCLMAIAMGIYVFSAKYFKPYLVNFKWLRIQGDKALELLKIGAPVAMQYIFEVSAFSGAALLIGTIGALPQAAHQIAISSAATTYMMASGIASATTIKVGTYLGQKKSLALRHVSIASYHIIIVFMCVTALFFILCSPFLPYVFTNDARVVAIASGLLIIAGFFQLFDGTQVIGLGVLRGIGDVNMPTLITFLSYWAIGIPVGYYLGINLKMGVNGIWYGLTIGLLTASILLFWRFQLKTQSLAKEIGDSNV